MFRKNKKIIITGSIIFLVVLFMGSYYLLRNRIGVNFATNILSDNLPNNNISYINQDNDFTANTYYQQLDEIFSLGRDYLLHNVQDDGSFVYLYTIDGNPKEDVKKGIIRQLLTFRVVAKLCQQGDQEFCQIHKKNLDYIFKSGIYQVSGSEQAGYLLYNDVAALGSNALALRLLMSSPYFDQYQLQAEALLNGIKKVQQADGSFQPYLVKPQGEFDYARKERFYSGEAVLALMEYYRKTNNQQILDMAKKSEDYYLVKYVDNMQKNYYPAYVPWHTMALSKLWHTTNDLKYTEAIFKLNDELLKMQDNWDYIGRFYSPEHPEYGKPHSASDAIYSESLVTAYRIALELNDEARQRNYMFAIKQSLGNIASLQLCNKSNPFNDIPRKLCGSLQVRKNSQFIRVDSLAHTMDFIMALRQLLDIK